MRWTLPKLPLFPYTTLFRSGSNRSGDWAPAHRTLDPAVSAHPPSPPSQRLNVDHAGYRLDGSADLRRDLELSRDRKSTRLNSSHRCISYAVFCLKKKNNVVK